MIHWYAAIGLMFLACASGALMMLWATNPKPFICTRCHAVMQQR